jgi:hypothetical protein
VSQPEPEDLLVWLEKWTALSVSNPGNRKRLRAIAEELAAFRAARDLAVVVYNDACESSEVCSHPQLELGGHDGAIACVRCHNRWRNRDGNR